MYRLTVWTMLIVSLLSSSLAYAGKASNHQSSLPTILAATRGLTATAITTRSVVVGMGSTTAEPSVALGGLFLSVQISPTLVSATTTSASLTVSAVCEGTEIAPLEVPSMQVTVPLPQGRTTATPLEIAVELPWDGGRKELADADYYADRSYSCIATVQLTASTSRRTRVTSTTALATFWDVLLAEQAVTIPTTEPSNGDEVNSATFETSSLDGTVGTVPVSIGISPETIVTVDGQALPPDSAVNISMDQPMGADIPSGATTPLFAAPVVQVGPEGATFDPPVILGLTPSGPLANTQNPIPLTYSEADEDWIDCRTNDSCTPVECPVATGFDQGMVCLEVHHFSLWTLGGDEQIALQLDLMDGSDVAPSWQCAPGAVCPSTLQFNAKVFSREAQPTGTWTARMQVCVDGNNDKACGGEKDTFLSGLDVANPVCFTGTNCTIDWEPLGAIVESTAGNYQITLDTLAYPSSNSLQVSVRARDVYLAIGYDDTKLPTKVTADSIKTHCPGNPPVSNSEALFDCLNLGVMPKLDQATFDPTITTLTATAGTTFSTNANLKAGALTLYWANADQCATSWNPAGAPTLALTNITSSSVSAAASSQQAANVRAKLTNTTYGTVLGPCVSVTALDLDGDLCVKGTLKTAYPNGKVRVYAPDGSYGEVTNNSYQVSVSLNQATSVLRAVYIGTDPNSTTDDVVLGTLTLAQQTLINHAAANNGNLTICYTPPAFALCGGKTGQEYNYTKNEPDSNPNSPVPTLPLGETSKLWMCSAAGDNDTAVGAARVDDYAATPTTANLNPGDRVRSTLTPTTPTDDGGFQGRMNVGLLSSIGERIGVDGCVDAAGNDDPTTTGCRKTSAAAEYHLPPPGNYGAVEPGGILRSRVYSELGSSNNQYKVQLVVDPCYDAYDGATTNGNGSNNSEGNATLVQAPLWYRSGKSSLVDFDTIRAGAANQSWQWLCNDNSKDTADWYQLQGSSDAPATSVAVQFVLRASAFEGTSSGKATVTFRSGTVDESVDCSFGSIPGECTHTLQIFPQNGVKIGVTMDTAVGNQRTAYQMRLYSVDPDNLPCKTSNLDNYDKQTGTNGEACVLQQLVPALGYNYWTMQTLSDPGATACSVAPAILDGSGPYDSDNDSALGSKGLVACPGDDGDTLSSGQVWDGWDCFRIADLKEYEYIFADVSYSWDYMFPELYLFGRGGSTFDWRESEFYYDSDGSYHQILEYQRSHSDSIDLQHYVCMHAQGEWGEYRLTVSRR